MSVALYEYTDQFKDLFTNSVEYVNNLQSPRFIKSHLPYQLLPTEMQKVKPKMIYIMRNPKDICVSYFYHCKLLHGFNVEFDTFCELFLNDAVAYGGIFNHYFEFWSRRHEDNLLILNYEEMKEDPKRAVRRIAEFLEKPMTEEEIESVVDFLSFQKMRSNKSCNAEVLLGYKKGKNYFEKTGYHFIRKGEVGDWKNHMTDEMSRRFDRWIEENTKDAEFDEILERDFTSTFRKGYITVEGVTMPKRFEDLKENIRNWSVKEEDVWICSFPKTGTTWTQEMVWMIMHNLDFVGGQVNLGHRSPFLEVSALFDYREFKKENADFQPPPFLDDSLKFVKNQSEKGPLCLKTHLPWVLLPKEVRDDTKHPKIIYVTRNPKDTCISYYNHSRLMEGYRGNFEDYCRLFLAGKLPFAPFWDHVLPFWERRNQSNILFLKYEEMIKDLPSIIRKVAGFLEKPLSDEQVEVLSGHLSFESMKKNPAVNYEMVVSLNRKYNLIECEGSFMRSGKVGDYKAKMSPEIIRQFDEWTKEHTEGADLFY